MILNRTPGSSIGDLRARGLASLRATSSSTDSSPLRDSEGGVTEEDLNGCKTLLAEDEPEGAWEKMSDKSTSVHSQVLKYVQCMCVCMYVCMSVCMYVYVYVYVYV